MAVSSSILTERYREENCHAEDVQFLTVINKAFPFWLGLNRGGKHSLSVTHNNYDGLMYTT